MESYGEYQARADVAEAQAPRIKTMTQLNRKEATVRAAMVKAGEADWAFDVGAEGAELAPEVRVGGAAEMVVMKIDTIWHPLLKKKEFRLALAHAMDCPTIVEILYGDYTYCSGNSAPKGALGLTPENSQPYEYDPEQAMELLQQAGYNGEEINFNYQANRFYKDNELVEAIAGYWNEVGIRTNLQALEASVNNDLGRSGCGRYSDNPPDCINQPPPPPAGVSPHIIISTPSLETLDFGKIALQTLSCSNIRSYVCEPDRLEPLIAQAEAATGDERKMLMEQIATILHDDALLIGVFEAFVVYGVDPNLGWEPRYDRRVRLNMMSFKQ
jgi:peptide/nickel transport system substrate-binding protein